MSLSIYTYSNPYEINNEPYWESIKYAAHFCVSQTMVNGLESIYSELQAGQLTTVEFLTEALYPAWDGTETYIKQYAALSDILQKARFKGSDNDKESFYTNLSHSGDYVVLAVGDSPGGIDVEYKNDKDFKVTKRMFTETEQSYILNGADIESSQQRFRDIWTINEAFLKCLGIGISVPLNTFEPKFDENSDKQYESGIIALIKTGKILVGDDPPEKLSEAIAKMTRKRKVEEYHFATYRVDGGEYSLTFVY